MQSYPLDLITLLHIFSRQRQTGELVAHEVRVPGSRKLGRAYLMLIDGNVDMASCVITIDKNVVLKGIDAFQHLQKAGVLDWVYTAQQPGSPASTMPSRNPAPNLRGSVQGSRFPVRVLVVSAEDFESSPAPLLYRSVYNMSDGEKSVEEIALLLRKPIEMIEEILASLYRHRAIDLLQYRRQDGRL